MMTEESTTSTRSRTTSGSGGGVGCCGCCASVLALILVATVLTAAQLLSWTRALWASLDPQQHTGVLFVALLAGVAALVVIWRARPHVTLRTRLVTTRAVRSGSGGPVPDRSGNNELSAEWRPTMSSAEANADSASTNTRKAETADTSSDSESLE